MTAALQRRAKQVRARATVRAWEYRQRGHAKGTWFRLRRALALAAQVYAITEEEARRLIEEGCAIDAVGAELSPTKVLVIVPRGRALAMAGRPLPARLGPELLAERFVALVPFDP